MALEDQIERVRGWSQSSEVFGSEASADARALWQTLRSVRPAAASMPFRRQLHSACSTLGLFHCRRYDARGDLVDLAKAVVCFVADDHSLVTPLDRLIGPAADPEEQARLGAQLLEASSPNDEDALLDASVFLLAASREDPSSLCLAYRLRYERTASADDLDRAIETGEKAATLAPGPDLWMQLAEAYELRHAARSDPTDLRRMIELFEHALQVDERAHTKLGTAYLLRYEQTGDVEALEKAVRHGEQGADPIPLSAALLRSFKRRNSLPDLVKAAALVAEDKLSEANLAGVISVLLTKYEYCGDQSDLGRAVRLGDQVFATLRDDHQRRPEILRAISQALHQRYLTTGTEADLNRATTLARWAFHALSPRQPHFAEVAANLATIHLSLYARTGVLAELDRAVELAETAATDDCPPEYTAILARAHHARFLVTKTPPDLQKAIELSHQAKSTTLAHDVAMPGRQADLAAAYRTRYGEFADPEDLDRAILLGSQAVRDTTDTHVDLPRRMSILAATYLDRYRVKQDPANLTAAVDLGERAWRHAAAVADQRGRMRLAADFAEALLVQVHNGGCVAPDLLAELIQNVTGSRSAEPADQVAGQHAIGRLALEAGQAELAIPILDAAVALLPTLPPRESGWTDRQLRVGDRRGLVEAVVSAHCGIGDAAGAVMTAELGRGVLLAAEANTRVDLTLLRDRQPRLADRFEWVCERLNAPEFPMDERKRWWADYDAELSKIRAIPGFEDFLVPPRVEDLRPKIGTAVLINAGRHGGHAVLLGANGAPKTIDLPDLLAVDDRVDELLDALEEGLTRRLRRLRVVPDVLAWLWDAVVEPVVSALPESPRPQRVWWAPTGVLGLLPLHAAGQPGQPGALDLLVSSFIPSLRSLHVALQRKPAQSRRELLVTMRHTPDQPDLLEAAAEGALLGGNQLQDKDAVAESVLAALTTSTWAHFACHAVADPVSPAESGLHLSDGTLKLPEIGGLRLDNAELAYLSACSTANHGLRHADEVLHLASAFQLAGFRHVVATLWPLTDHIAAEAARAFYRRLPDGPHADTAAQTLREVTLELRAKHADRPDLWATLVHSGP